MIDQGIAVRKIYELVQEHCTCGRKDGARYTNYEGDHAEDCGYRIALQKLRAAKREEGFRRA